MLSLAFYKLRVLYALFVCCMSTVSFNSLENTYKQTLLEKQTTAAVFEKRIELLNNQLQSEIHAKEQVVTNRISMNLY